MSKQYPKTMPLRPIKVDRVSEANGAACTGCTTAFHAPERPNWQRNKDMHERITGHRMQLYKLEL